MIYTTEHVFVVCTFGREAANGSAPSHTTMSPPFNDRLSLGQISLIRSSMTADEVRDLFLETAGAAKILVIKAGDQAAWSGFNAIDADWLLKRL